MEATIFTYGHGETMFQTLTAIKMICNHGLMDGMIQMVGTITVGYYSILGMYRQATREYLFKTIGLIAIVGTLLQGKTSMVVDDLVTNEKYTVDKLPYAFVIPVGVFEGVGAMTTRLFEQAFTKPNSAPYTSHGMIFGGRLVSEARNWRIANPEFAGNMDAFIKRCVVMESMIGARFTPDELLNEPDLVDFIKRKSGTFRKVLFRHGSNRRSYNCREAATELEKYFGNELHNLSAKYIGTDFVNAGRRLMLGGHEGPPSILNSQLTANIELAYSSSLGVDNLSATDIVRQNMMINSIKNYTNKADLYGYTRAAGQQESSWRIAGDLASEYLPLLLTVMKGLIYASFIFMVPLMLLAGGMQRYLNYLLVIASLQLWPALNAVLNMFIETYSFKVGSGLTAGVLTYSNFNQAHSHVDKIVAVASGLQLSIPFLCMAIIRGGVEGFINLASNITGASQSAATMAASEVVSGNRSFDNTNIGNMQYANNSAFKTDLSSSYSEGGSSFTHADGTIERTTSGGGTFFTSGGGITESTGRARYELNSDVKESLSDSYSHSQGLALDTQVSFDKAKTSTVANTAELATHLAQREAAGEKFDYDRMGEQGTALQEAVNSTKILRDQNNYSWEQAGRMAVNSSANTTASTPSVLPVKAEVSVGTEASLSATNSSSQDLGTENQSSTESHTNESFSNLVKAASNENWMKENSIDTSYAQNVRGSYEKMQSLHESLSMHQEDAKRAETAMNYANSQGAMESRDMRPELEQRLIDKHGVSRHGAHQMIEQGDNRARMAWQNIVDKRVDEISGMISQNKAKITNGAADRRISDFKNEQLGKLDTKPQNQIDSGGLDVQTFKNKISNQGQKIKRIQGEIRQENNQFTQEVKTDNLDKADGLKKRADKYERNRVSSSLGIGGPKKKH